jgi:hypothetical protein
MSLDFSLDEQVTCEQCGHVQKDQRGPEVFSRNITHNLGGMADAAGLYDCLWRPVEHNCDMAWEIVTRLEQGLQWLRENPDEAKGYDAENGWGTYTHFVPFVEAVLAACQAHPMATIRVSV